VTPGWDENWEGLLAMKAFLEDREAAGK